MTVGSSPQQAPDAGSRCKIRCSSLPSRAENSPCSRQTEYLAADRIGRVWSRCFEGSKLHRILHRHLKSSDERALRPVEQVLPRDPQNDPSVLWGPPPATALATRLWICDSGFLVGWST